MNLNSNFILEKKQEITDSSDKAIISGSALVLGIQQERKIEMYYRWENK